VRGSNTSPSLIQVTWTALTTTSATGGMSILSYHLEYDDGTGEAVEGSSWVDLVGYPSHSLLTEYTVAGTSIIGGTTYQLRVRAGNAIGWGDWSTVTSVVASAAPAQMVAVATVIDGVYPLSVKISWTAPSDNSDTITSYKILIRESDGITYSEETTNCDGLDSTIRTNRECYVPLTTLRTDFGLEYGDLVVARARATNSIGDGQYSQPNSAGATIQTEPEQVAVPTRGATTLTSIVVNWVALTGDSPGGATIDSYEL
jgi:hypothetical protein